MTSARSMKAAVVTSFNEPPHYRDFDAPIPSGAAKLVDVLAVGLHPRTRSGASGAHYTSTGTLPMIPGVDGVGRTQDGRLLYFSASDDNVGTMADHAVADPRRSIELPADADVVKVAAAMNPAMSSWVALRRRVRVQDGQSVLVLGATGNAGSMAVRIAKHLGAGRVIGAGRDAERLAALSAIGADDLVRLTDDPQESANALAAVAADVDVVLDYLWGSPTADALPAIVIARSDRSRELNWVQIGSMAGSDITLPSAALRSANLRLLGSGQGSIGIAEYLAELPSLVDALDTGVIPVDTETASLRDVEAVWGQPETPGRRMVLIP